MGREGSLPDGFGSLAPCPFLFACDLFLVPSSLLQAAASGSLPRCSS